MTEYLPVRPPGISCFRRSPARTEGKAPARSTSSSAGRDPAVVVHYRRLLGARVTGLLRKERLTVALVCHRRLAPTAVLGARTPQRRSKALLSQGHTPWRGRSSSAGLMIGVRGGHRAAKALGPTAGRSAGANQRRHAVACILRGLGQLRSPCDRVRRARWLSSRRRTSSPASTHDRGWEFSFPPSGLPTLGSGGVRMAWGRRAELGEDRRVNVIWALRLLRRA